MKRSSLAILSMASLLLLSCEDCDDSTGIVATDRVAQRMIMPTVANPGIISYNHKPHFTYFHPGVEAKNKLVVYLPDAGSLPENSKLFGQHAAELGFHSVGLMYEGLDVTGICSDQANVDVFEQTRLEVITGQDTSGLVVVAQASGIVNRLSSLLTYMDMKYPGENWGQYLIDGQPDFEKIIVAGNVEGAGHAALIAKHYAVDRALCFSFPAEHNLDGTHAPWLSGADWATPKDRIYAFAHEDHDIEAQHALWDALQLPGNNVAVEGRFTDANRLVTAHDLWGADVSAAVIEDDHIPVIDGQPAYIPVWSYLLTNDSGL